MHSVLFTLALLAVYRIGAHIPTPGINWRVLLAATAAVTDGNIPAATMRTAGSGTSFTVASVLCGFADSLGEFVAAHLNSEPVPPRERVQSRFLRLRCRQSQALNSIWYRIQEIKIVELIDSHRKLFKIHQRGKVLAVTGPHAREEVMDAVHAHLPRPHDPFVDRVPPGTPQR